MGNLWVNEAVVSDRGNGRRYGLGESGVYETFTDDRGELFRSYVREHGRCIGKVYVDRKDKPPAAVGWIFIARRPFEDDPTQSSLIETWVTVHTGPPTETIDYHLALQD